MAHRITTKLLENLLNVAITTLQEQGLTVNSEYKKSGCILLGHSGYGHALEMILRDGETGTTRISDTMTAKEMYHFLHGIISTGTIKHRLNRVKELN